MPVPAALATTSRYERVRSSRPSGRLSRLPTACSRVRPGARALRRVHVDQLEVGDPVLAVAHDLEHGESLHRVLEQPRVALLRGLQVPEVPPSQHHEQRRGDEDEGDALDRREHQLEVVRQGQPRQDPVGEDDPGDGHDGIDRARSAAPGAAPLGAAACGPRPGLSSLQQPSSRSVLGDSAGTGRTLLKGTYPGARYGTSRASLKEGRARTARRVRRSCSCSFAS